MKERLREVVFILMSVYLAFQAGGCHTVKGAASDVREVASWVERTLEPVEDQLYRDRVERAAQLVMEEKVAHAPK